MLVFSNFWGMANYLFYDNVTCPRSFMLKAIKYSKRKCSLPQLMYQNIVHQTHLKYY